MRFQISYLAMFPAGAKAAATAKKARTTMAKYCILVLVLYDVSMYYQQAPVATDASMCIYSSGMVDSKDVLG